MTGIRQCAGRHVRNLVVVATIASCPATPRVSAQTASEPALKSAFLYNFTKFTDWPAEALPPGDPLVLCVVNDAVIAGMLETLTKGRSVAGHALVVSPLAKDSATLALSACRVLYLSGADHPGSAALLGSLSGKPILTVGEGEGFARAGGVVGLFVKDGTLQFAINTSAAQRAGLLLSSKLLSLAKLVKEDRRADSR